MDANFAIWGELDDIRFLLGMIALFALVTSFAVLLHVARHWNDMYDEEDDDAGESPDGGT